MAKLLGFIRPLIRPVFNRAAKPAISPSNGAIASPRRKHMAPAPFASASSARQPRRPRQPLRIYRDPSHIVMVGSIHDICRKLDQAVAERYCHIDG